MHCSPGSKHGLYDWQVSLLYLSVTEMWYSVMCVCEGVTGRPGGAVMSHWSYGRTLQATCHLRYTQLQWLVSCQFVSALWVHCSVLTSATAGCVTPTQQLTHLCQHTALSQHLPAVSLGGNHRAPVDVYRRLPHVWLITWVVVLLSCCWPAIMIHYTSTVWSTSTPSPHSQENMWSTMFISHWQSP